MTDAELARYWEDRANKYLKMAEHMFQTPQKSDDDPYMERCAKCGLNIRDEVHTRWLRLWRCRGER